MHIYFDVVFFSMNYWHCTLYINRIFIKKNINKSMNLKTLIKNDKFMPEKYYKFGFHVSRVSYLLLTLTPMGFPFWPRCHKQTSIAYERSKFNFFLVLMATVLLRWRFFFLKSTFYYFIIIYSRKGICYFS